VAKPTILYIGGFELPDRNAAAHRVLGNAKVLRALGYEVVLIGVSKESVGTHLEETRGSVQGFDTWSVPYPRSTVEWAKYVCSIDSLLAVAAHYERVVSIVCYDYPAVALWRTIRHCRDRGVRCICDCTEWYAPLPELSILSVAKRMDTLARMRFVQKRSDGVICISTFLQRYYERHVPTVWVPPLVDLDEPKWRTCAEPRVGSGCVFVYAGSPGERKDRLDTVIEALQEVDESLDYSFRVAGLSREDYLRMHPGQAELVSKLGDRVVFLGRLSHAESLAEVRSACYAVFVRECNRTSNAGFPTKFVESVACGTPVITTSCSDLPTYIVDGRTGFFVDDHSKGLGALMSGIASGEIVLPDAVDPHVFDYRSHTEDMRAFIAALESDGGDDA
jgi:glycosyltransferase involved in cell wall biosynthesis